MHRFGRWLLANPVWAAVGLAAVSFGLSLIVAHWLFPLLSTNNDEAVYLFQAKIYRSGHLTLSAEPYRDFFRPWMSAEHHHHLVLVFQPVFPLVLALSDLLFGSMRVAIALIAAGCVLVMYALARELGLPARARIIACGVFALSPFVVIQSGLYLEYLFAVLLEMSVLTLLFGGLRQGGKRRIAWLVATGLVFGLLVFTRPLEAVILGVAMVAYLVVRDRNVIGAARDLAWPVAGASPIVAIMLVYNAYLTGHPLHFPLWSIGGNNAFGFGRRNIVAGSPLIDVTFVNGLKALHQNLRSLPHWIFGSVFIVPFAFYGLWTRRREPSTVALAAIGVLVPFGYLFYWGNLLIVNGRKAIGPHYYMAMLIPTALFAAIAIDRGLRHRRAVVLGVALLLVVATGIELPDKIDRNHDITEAYRAEQAAIDANVHGAAIVILPVTADGAYLMHPRGWLMNDLHLRNTVLYAADRGPSNIDLSQRFPDRSLYRLQPVEATREPLTFRPSVRELRVARAAGAYRRTVSAPVPAATGTTRAYVQATGTDRASCVVMAESGHAHIDVRRDATGVELRGCADAPVRVATTAVDATITVGFEFGSSSKPQPLELRELRVWTRVEGSEVLALNEETWRIVPGDRINARIIESNDLVVAAEMAS